MLNQLKAEKETKKEIRYCKKLQAIKNYQTKLHTIKEVKPAEKLEQHIAEYNELNKAGQAEKREKIKEKM
jgi:hypothetical protein